MKSTRRVLTAILAFAMAISMSLNLFADFYDYDWDWMAQGRALGAHEVFYTAVYGHSRYPERTDFAGMWYDQNKNVLVVAVTENCDMDFYHEILDFYYSLSENHGNVEFTTLKYPLKTLYEMRDDVFDALKDIMSAAGVDESENVIDFMVRIDAEEARPLILQAMTEIKTANNLPDGIENAFKVEYGIVEPLEGWDDDTVVLPLPTEHKCAESAIETI